MPINRERSFLPNNRNVSKHNVTKAYRQHVKISETQLSAIRPNTHLIPQQTAAATEVEAK